MKIITVDAGKYNTKGIVDGKQIIFRTKMEEVDNSVYSDRINTFHIHWENKNYLLGDGVKDVDYDTNKHKLQHKLAVYTACSELTRGEEEDLYLVVLCPIEMFLHPQRREEFRQFILDDGKIELEINKSKKVLTLKDVTIFSEACATVFSNYRKFKNQIKGIIDIGGLNVNGVVISNMSPVKGTEFTINAGSYLIMEKIKKELNKQLKINIQNYQMEFIIQQGYHNYNKETSVEIIQEILSDHFKEIKQNMKANNWDVDGLEIVVTGGGSLNLGIDNIKKHLRFVEQSNNPIWDNVIGGKIIGEMIYE